MICYATIRESSPRYPTWLEVFGTDTVPIESDRSVIGTVPGLDGPRRFYFLSVNELDKTARENLNLYVINCYVSGYFRRPSDGEHTPIGRHPILAEDVVVSYRGDFYL